MPDARDDTLLAAVRTLLTAAIERLGDRPETRDAALALARWAVEELERAPVAARTTAPTGVATAVTPAPPVPASEPTRVVPPPRPVGHPKVIAHPPLVETTLRIGDLRLEGIRVAGTPEQARAAAEAAARTAPDTRDEIAHRGRNEAPDISIAAQRARLKAEACRWAIERRRRVASGADFLAEIKPTDASLIERARSMPDCYLWMLDPRGALPDDGTLDALAGAYDTLGLAADVAREITGDNASAPTKPAALGAGASAIRRDLYWLVAEAQSALRFGVLQTGQRIDRDQMDVFIWLRDHTNADRIFVDRHMKVDDPADPTNSRDLAARLEGLLKAWRGGQSDERKQAELRRKATYHAQRVAGARDSAAALHDWTQLLVAIEGLTAMGVAPSNREITDLLLPLRDVDPPEAAAIGPGARQALAATERLAAQLAERETEADSEAGRERSAEAAQAAELLRGKVVVFIGGERRREAQERIERDLELAELRWNTTAPHQSLSVFEPEIARPEVSVVLLAIRWSSHSYGELQDVCNRYGKILVRLPGGYSSNQIASQVLAQAGDRLRLAPAGR